MLIDPAAIRSQESLYLSLADRFGTDRPSHGKFHALRGRHAFATEVGVIDLQEAIVLTGEWFVIVGDHVLADFFVQTPLPPRSAYFMRYPSAGEIDVLYEDPVASPVAKAFLLGGCSNYSHWLLDYLPRLALCPDGGLPVLVNGPLAPFQEQSLSCLGVEEGRWLPLVYPMAVAVPNLLYPSVCSSSIVPPHSFQPWVIDWLRQAFAPLLATSRPWRKIFISRAREVESARRRLMNHEEILAVAERLGFEVVAPETLTFTRQVELFSEAAVICGPHGAGFTNMVFAPKDTRVVELVGPRHEGNKLSLAYANLAKLLGQSHARIVGRSDALAEVQPGHTPYETYTIDPDLFERAVLG